MATRRKASTHTTQESARDIVGLIPPLVDRLSLPLDVVMASNESTPRTSESDGLCSPPSPDKAASRSTPYCVPEEAAGPGDKPPLGVLLFHVHDGIARDPAEGGIVCVQGRCEVCAGGNARSFQGGSRSRGEDPLGEDHRPHLRRRAPRGRLQMPDAGRDEGHLGSTYQRSMESFSVTVLSDFMLR